MFDISGFNACGCLGPMYGEPHCPCTMRSLGLEEQMKQNPIRIKANEEAQKRWEEAKLPGGWLHKMFEENKQRTSDEHRS